MPGFEELIAFIERDDLPDQVVDEEGQDETNPQGIPKAMYIDLIALINQTEKFELEFIINSIKDGVVASVEQKSETEDDVIRMRLDKLEGSSSNFFLELLLSVIIEYNIIGRILHRGAKGLIKIFGPAMSRKPTVNTFSGKTRYISHLSKTEPMIKAVTEKPQKYRGMMLGIAERAANYAKSTPGVTYGRDTVTALAGPIAGELARKKIRNSDIHNSETLHLTSNISLIIKGGLENYKKDISGHYGLLRKELEKHKEGLIEPEMSMEEFRSLVRLHHYNQDVNSNEINKLVTGFVKKVIWTLVLEENDPGVLEWLKLALSNHQIPNPAYDFETADRERALADSNWFGDDEDKGNAGLPLAFYPGQRFQKDENLIGLLAKEFSIVHKKKVASIHQHAIEEFPSITGKETSDDKMLARKAEMESYLNEPKAMRGLGRGPTGGVMMPKGTPYVMKNTEKARKKFMKKGVISVLNETANLLKKHELGDLDWLIVNKASELTIEK